MHRHGWMHPTNAAALQVLFMILFICQFENSCCLQESENAVSKLLSETLKNDDVVLIVDSDVYRQMNMDQILRHGVTDESSYVIMESKHVADLTDGPEKLVRGFFMTTMFMFTNDIIEDLNSLAESDMFSPEHLILFCLNSSLELESILKHEVIQRSRNIILIRSSKQNDTLLEVYTVNHNHYHEHTREDIKTYIGILHSEDLPTKESLFKRDEFDFRGAKLKLASFCDDFPFLYTKEILLEDSFDSVFKSRCFGASLDIFDIIAEDLNFTYEIQMNPPDYMWGSLENGSWNGMLGQLYRGEKDLMINNIILTQEQVRDFDPSPPYFQEGFAILVKEPPASPKWKGVTNPFTLLVWISIVLVSCGVYVLWMLGLLCVPNEQKTDRVFLQIISGLTRVSYREQFSLNWNHQVAVLWWLVGFVISAAYTSNLVAFLTVPIPTKRIETINELAESNLRLMMHDYGSLVPGALKKSTDPALNKLGSGIELFTKYEEYLTVGFPNVLNYTHALVNTEAYITFLGDVANVTAQTYLMKEVLFPGHLVYYWPKNSPQKWAVSSRLQRLFEANLFERAYKDHLEGILGEKKGTGSVSGTILELEHLAGVFFLALGGYFLSFLAFCAEVLPGTNACKTLAQSFQL